MTRHVSAEALARYREGDLGSRKSSRIRAHLAACPRCTALDQDLAGVSALLASAPRPTMPEQVTARIQAALIAEGARQVPLSAGREPGRPELASQPGRSRHAAGRTRDGRRWHLPELLSPVAVRAFAAAAAAVAIAGGIYGTVQLAGDQPGATSGSASASNAAGSERHGLALTGPPLAYGSASHPADITPVSTGMNFQPGLLKSQVRSVLPRSGANAPMSHPQATAGKPGAFAGPSVTTPDKRSFSGLPISALRGCVTRISAGRKVLLVDVDRYQGKRATIIVIAGAGGAGGARVWVVGPGCSRTGSDVIAQASLPGAG
jgi:Putative zinc-finger